MSKAPVFPDYPKRLIEVDLPIRALSAAKSKRPPAGDVDVRDSGLWWSRKPQNQCRAIIFAALLPDPSNRDPKSVATVAAVLQCLHELGIASGEECVGDENVRRETLVRFCRLVAEPDEWGARISAATTRIMAILQTSDLVSLDPFSGGGSIPIEARRLGLNSIAGEYNPVALDQLRAALEWGSTSNLERLKAIEPPLLEAVAAAQRIAAHAYPASSASGHLLGFVAFRAVTCEGPSCGRIVPATSKFILDVRGKVRVVISAKNKPGQRVGLRLVEGDGEPSPEPSMGQGKLRCPVCDFVMRRADVVRQLSQQRQPDFIVAAVLLRSGKREIKPVPKDVADRLGAWDAHGALAEVSSWIPVEAWPATEPRRFSPPLYGLSRFSDCHTQRQLYWLATLVRELHARIPTGGDAAKSALYAGVARLLVERLVDRHTSFCRWRSDRGGSFEWTFAGKSLGMIWDFFEANPLHADNDATLVLREILQHVDRCAHRLSGVGSVLASPAQKIPLPDDAADLVYTDPPYFDAIPYAHLSDWMFVWARRLNRGVSGDIALAPKDREIVVDRPHSKSPTTHDAAYFTRELRAALGEARRVLKPEGIGIIVFAHSSTTAWESLVSALLDAGFVVTASWPVETERGGRLQAQGTASLESSIHIVCRPRENPDGSLRTDYVGEWRDVLAELPIRIHDWMPRLAKEGIVGADAIFACIGPALEVFSRYSRVEKPSGDPVLLTEYLEEVWSAVAKEALKQIFAGADTAGFEADARLTAMWLWTLSPNGQHDQTADGANDDSDDEDGAGTKRSKGGFALEFDAARKIAMGLGARLEELATLVEVAGDTARLLPVAERTQALFGKGAAAGGTGAPKRKKKQLALGFVDELEEAEASAGWGDTGAPERADTVLDRLHQAMILFGSGRSEALKRFLVDDGIGRDNRFWKLAQALSVLYPPGTDERRWVEGVQARKKGLGF